MKSRPGEKPKLEPTMVGRVIGEISIQPKEVSSLAAQIEKMGHDNFLYEIIEIARSKSAFGKKLIHAVVEFAGESKEHSGLARKRLEANRLGRVRGRADQTILRDLTIRLHLKTAADEGWSRSQTVVKLARQLSVDRTTANNYLSKYFKKRPHMRDREFFS